MGRLVRRIRALEATVGPGQGNSEETTARVIEIMIRAILACEAEGFGAPEEVDDMSWAMRARRLYQLGAVEFAWWPRIDRYADQGRAK